MAVWRPQPDWFAAAVDSALAQRGVDIELIIVDDGNDVPVAELLADVTDERLRVARLEHTGLSGARNAGTALARGTWLRYVDADDVLLEDSTAHLVELTGGSDSVITYGAILVCDEELRPVWKMTCHVQGPAVEASLLGQFTTRIHAMLIPRHVAEQAGPWDARFAVAMDKDWSLRAFEHAPVRGDDFVCTYYRKHGESNTQKTLDGLQCIREITEKYFERHPEQRGSSLERRAFAAVEASTARVYAVRGPRRYVPRHLMRAARLSPRAIATEGRQSWAALTPTLRRAVRARRKNGSKS